MLFTLAVMNHTSYMYFAFSNVLIITIKMYNLRPVFFNVYVLFNLSDIIAERHVVVQIVHHWVLAHKIDHQFCKFE